MKRIRNHTVCVWARVGVLAAAALFVWLLLLPPDVARAMDIGAALKGGSTGLGGDVTVGLNDAFNLRIGFNWLSFSVDDEGEDDDDADVRARFYLQSAPLLLDWHPNERHFRVSFGMMFNNNEAEFTSKEPGSFEFNKRDYLVDDFDMDIAFNQLAPYIGIGYGNAISQDGRWQFALDFGFMFHGSPRVRGRATASNPAEQESLDQDVRIEMKDTQDDLRAFVVYPVLTMGLSYRF